MKTITVYGMELKLTDERKRRINESLIETQEKLEKEKSYSPELRNDEQVAFYESHIDHLLTLLD